MTPAPSDYVQEDDTNTATRILPITGDLPSVASPVVPSPPDTGMVSVDDLMIALMPQLTLYTLHTAHAQQSLLLHPDDSEAQRTIALCAAASDALMRFTQSIPEFAAGMEQMMQDRAAHVHFMHKSP
jgi:hypothetical protein